MPEEQSQRSFVTGFRVDTSKYKSAVTKIEGHNDKIAASVRKLAKDIESSGVVGSLNQITTAVDRAARNVNKLRGGGGALGGRKAVGEITQTAKALGAVGNRASGAAVDMSKLEESSRKTERAMNRMLKVSIKSARATGANATSTRELARQVERSIDPIDKYTAILGKKNAVTQKALSSEDKVIAKFKQTFGRLGIYAVATGVIYAFVQAMRTVITTMIDVQYGMAQLEKVMISGTNFEEVERGFFRIAKRYGLSIQDVISSGKIFAQQGLNQVEVLALTETALLGVTAANLGEQQAVEALTAATKIYNIEAAKSVGVIDKLARVQARHAVTAKDLADAIRVVGPVVKILDGNIDDVIGTTAALVAITRKSGKEVANSLKTIFARLARPITRTKFKAIADVEIMQDPKTFKPLMRILGELRDRWDQLSNAEKVGIAQAAGGIRRYQDFVVLMDNYAEVLTATRDSQEEGNYAMEVSQIEARTLRREIARLQTTWLEFGNTWLKGMMAPEGLSASVKLLQKLGSGLEWISNISPPAGAVASIGGLVFGIKILEKGVRVLLKTMIPSIQTTTAIGMLFGWLRKKTLLAAAAITFKVASWFKADMAAKRYAVTVRKLGRGGSLLTRALRSPWAWAAVAIGVAVFKVWEYQKAMRDLKTGSAALAELNSKWDTHAIAVGAASKALEAYSTTLNELGETKFPEGRPFTPFSPQAASAEEIQKAMRRVVSAARGGGGTGMILPSMFGGISDEIIRAAQKARKMQFESVGEMRGLFGGSRIAGATNSELLRLLELEVSALGGVKSAVGGVISEMLDLGTVSEVVIRALAIKLQTPTLPFEEMEKMLATASVPTDQIQRLKAAWEDLGKVLEPGLLERALKLLSNPNIVGGGLVAPFATAEENKRIAEFANRIGKLQPLLERYLGLWREEKSVKGFKDKFKDHAEIAQEATEATIKIKDVYNDVLDSTRKSLAALGKQRAQYRAMGLGFDFYKRQLGLVKTATDKLTSAEVNLEIQLAKAKRELARGVEAAGNLALPAQIRTLDLMEKKVQRLQAALVKFREASENMPEDLLGLRQRIEPDQRTGRGIAFDLRARKEALSLTEKTLRSNLKLSQLQRFGADTARNIVEKSKERVALERELFVLRVDNLQALVDTGKISNDQFLKSLSLLEIKHKGNVLETQTNTALQARQALLDRQMESTGFIKRNIRDALVDWESLASGQGALNFVDAIARRQRELLADALIDSLPDDLGNMFFDPAKKRLEEQLQNANTIAFTIEEGIVGATATSIQMYTQFFGALGTTGFAGQAGVQAIERVGRGDAFAKAAVTGMQPISRGDAGVPGGILAGGESKAEALGKIVAASKSGASMLDMAKAIRKFDGGFDESPDSLYRAVLKTTRTEIDLRNAPDFATRGWEQAVPLTPVPDPVRGGVIPLSLTRKGTAADTQALAEIFNLSGGEFGRKGTTAPAVANSQMQYLAPLLAGLVSQALVRATGGNAQTSAVGSTLGMVGGSFIPGLPPGVGMAIGSAVGGLLGGLIGGGKDETVVKENTRAIQDNTQAVTDLSSQIISAPASFVMPAVKGQIPSLSGGGEITRSGLALVHRGETVSQGPRQAIFHITQLPGENSKELADRIVDAEDRKYGQQASRSGSRGRVVAM